MHKKLLMSGISNEGFTVQDEKYCSNLIRRKPKKLYGVKWENRFGKRNNNGILNQIKKKKKKRIK